MTHDDIVFLNDDDEQPRSQRTPDQGTPAQGDQLPTHSTKPHFPQAEIVGDASPMTEIPMAQLVGDTPPPSSKQPLPRSRFGVWYVAWPVILLLAGLIFAGPYLAPPEETAPDPSAEISQLEIQGKYMLGLSNTPSPMSDPQQVKNQVLTSVAGMKEGSWESRLCHAILVGEFDSPESAIKQLDALQVAAEEAGYQPNETQAELRQSLVSLYEDYERQEWTAPSLEDSQRDMLQGQLGWFGELALTPAEGPEDIRRDELVTSAQTLMIVLASAAIGVLLVGCGGFVATIFFAVLTFLGKIRSALTLKTMHGNIYIETFAIWFVLFLAISVAIKLLNLNLPLAAQSAMSSLSLIALVWPMVRRVSFHDLRHEIGLYAKNPIMEIMWGFVCYFATLPLMAIGLLTMLIMMAVRNSFVEQKPFEVLQGPSHPIGEWLIDANWWSLLQIFILAAIVAPIIEEIMFRGVLYRHLRDTTARFRTTVSVILSTFVNSLIFAAIHPQGIFGIPLLMSLAVGFSLAREWRGSLIAPMTMHAINNGGVTLLAGFMLSTLV